MTRRNRRFRSAAGFTMVEVVLATLLVSLTLVAALNAVGAARAAETRIAEHGKALHAAHQLMAEILQQEYADPLYGPGSVGVGSDEDTGNRSLFDDVDDYDNWTATPPQQRDGTPVPGLEGYAESVQVKWVQAADRVSTSNGETGVKRIVVSVTHSERLVVTLVAYRTQAWSEPAELQELDP